MCTPIALAASKRDYLVYNKKKKTINVSPGSTEPEKKMGIHQ